MARYVSKFFSNLKGLLSKKGIAFVLFGPLLASILAFLVIVPIELINNILGSFLSLISAPTGSLPVIFAVIMGLIGALIQLGVGAFFGIYIVKFARLYLSDKVSLSSLKIAFKRAYRRWFVGFKSFIIVSLISALIFIVGSILGFSLIMLSQFFHIKGLLFNFLLLFGLILSILIAIFLSIVFWPLNFIIEGTEIKSAISIVKKAFSIGKSTFFQAFEVILSSFLVKIVPAVLAILFITILLAAFGVSLSPFISNIAEGKPQVVLGLFLGVIGVGLFLLIPSFIFVFAVSLFASSASTITLLELFDEVKQSFLS